MANVNQDLPGLQDLVGKLKILQAAPIPQEMGCRELGMAVGLGHVLMQRRPQGNELAVSIGNRFQDQLFWLFELGIELQGVH